MTDTITFRTADQAALYNHEIRGQLSDGCWENASPQNHWRPWCRAEVAVGQISGRNFYAQKCNYNLTRPDLLDVIGKRMVAMIRLIRAFGDSNYEIVKHCVDLDGNFRVPTYEGEYYAKIRNEFSRWLGEQHLTIDAVRAVVESHPYDRKQLLNDLREMKEAMKTKI